jgi:hypothetical protein
MSIEVPMAEMQKIAGMLKTAIGRQFPVNFNLRIWSEQNRGKEDFETFHAKVIITITESGCFNDIQKSMLLHTANKKLAAEREEAAKKPQAVVVKGDGRVTTHQRRLLYNELVACKGLSIQAFCERKGKTVEAIRAIVKEFGGKYWYTLWQERYEYHDRKIYTDEVLEGYYQGWLYSNPKVSLFAFCNSQEINYNVFREFCNKNHKEEVESVSAAIDAEREAANKERDAAIKPAVDFKLEHPEEQIQMVCDKFNISRDDFKWYTQRWGIKIKSASAARSEMLLAALMDPDNKYSFTELCTMNGVGASTFYKWVEQNGLPDEFEQTMEEHYNKCYGNGSSVWDYGKDNNVNPIALLFFAAVRHPNTFTKFGNPIVEAKVEEAPEVEVIPQIIEVAEPPKPLEEIPAKTPVVREIAKELNVEVVEITAKEPEKVPFNKEAISERINDLFEDIGLLKEVFSKMDTPETREETVVGNLEELCTKQDAEKVTISGSVVKEIAAKVNELNELKAKLKALLG